MAEHWNETGRMLANWSDGSEKAEFLAAQILLAEGFTGLDPSHPFGGPDGKRDAMCSRGTGRWVAAVYFAREQSSDRQISRKFTADLEGARTHDPDGFVFVTNQKLTNSLKSDFEELAGDLRVELLHLYRIQVLLDSPQMAQVRQQFLGIAAPRLPADARVSVQGGVVCLYGSDELQEAWISTVRSLELDGAEDSADEQPSALMKAVFNGPPPKKLTRQELEKRLHGWQGRVEQDWPQSVDYLAAHICDGVQFRLQNVTNVFLPKVRVVIELAGVRGVWWRRDEDLVEDKWVEPFRKAPQSRWGPVVEPTMDWSTLRTKDYPVEWENTEAGVRVTITLDALRPADTWTSDNDDLVLLCDDSATTEVEGTWALTALDHHERYQGTIPPIRVTKLSLWDLWSTAHGDDT